MKRMKKVVTLIMALAMVLAFAVPAMAAEETTYTITINNDEAGHIYEAYQIFTGELHGTVLSNITWGSGVTQDANTQYGAADAIAERLDLESDAKLFAKGISSCLSHTYVESSYDSEGKKYTISGLNAGYYLIKDQDSSLNGTDKVYTEYIIKVVANAVASPKDGEASFTKKVEDCNDTMSRKSEWQDSADYDIDDNVPFQLIANLPENLSSFDNGYKVVIHDTLSKGLTYNPNSLTIYIGGNSVENLEPVVTTKSDDGSTELTFTFENVRNLTGAENGARIVITYDAKLNEHAVVGSAGNPNTAYMEYSNNPNGTGMGKTVDDTVIVFTYKVIVNKVDENNDPLDGATFKLEKILSTGARVEVAMVTVENGTQFIFKGLDDGDYILTETVTPKGYNSIKPIKFTVTAEHDVLADEPKLNNLTGNVTSGEIEFTPSVSDCSLTGTVMNQSGATLPETGGMGTTLFYILGAILVIGAGVALVTRKRMS